MLGSSCYCLNLGFVVVKKELLLWWESGGRSSLPLLLFNFQSFAKKHLLPPPALCHLTSLWECLGMGSLEAKRRKVEKKNPPEFQQSASLCH